MMYTDYVSFLITLAIGRNVHMKNNVIGERIRYERHRLGLTQEELGANVNVSKNCIGSWEKGRTIPDVFALDKLAVLFGIEIKDFLCELDSDSLRVGEFTSAYVYATHQTIDITERELSVLYKLRAQSSEYRKAFELLLGMRNIV